MDIHQMKREVSPLTLQDQLTWAYKLFKDKIVFSTSFSAEDMVVLDAIYALNIPITLITLDTGRLHKETYEFIEKVKTRYAIKLNVYYPDYNEVEKLTTEKGFFSFRESIQNRKECCMIRKVNSLRRALQGKELWITGLRRSQSVTREKMEIIERNDQFELWKLNPLLEWSHDEVWEYIKKNRVPYNPLHDKGFPSIGCEPCTREVRQGEDIRGGRWWWENPEQRECGLHLISKRARE